jgi:ABC-type multidrug transport system ATPase subunit
MILTVEDISKRLLGLDVLQNISFTAKPGMILGIAGAGKSTLLRILANLWKPDSGTVLYDDRPFSRKVRPKIGYLPQNISLPDYPTSYEILYYAARLKGLTRRAARVETIRLLDRFEMIEVIDKRLADDTELSRDKLALLMTIIHQPELILFDEPFADHQHEAVEMFLQLLPKFRESGKTVIVASSDDAQLENCCDEIILLHEGEICFKGIPVEVRAGVANKILHVAAPYTPDLEMIKGVQKVIANKVSATLLLDEQIKVIDVIRTIEQVVPQARITIRQPGMSEWIQLHAGEANGEQS